MMLMLFIIIIIFVSVYGFNQVNDTAKRIMHSHEVLIHSEKLQTLVADNETDSRSYILTGKESYLEPLDRSGKEIHKQLGLLKEITSGNPQQQSWVDSVLFYIDKRFALSYSTVSVKELNGVNAALAIVDTGRGRLYTDNVRFFAGKLQEAENVLLLQYKDANELAVGKMNRIRLTLGIVVFVLIVFLLFLFRSRYLSQKKLAIGLEEEIRYKTAELSSVMERITDAFYAVDTNWRFTYMNKMAGEILERIPQNMIGKNIWAALPDSANEPIFHALHRAMKDQQYIQIEDYYSPNDKWFENHIYPSPNGLSVFFRDITEKKKSEFALKESEEKYRILFQRNMAGVFSTRPGGTILACNDAYARMLGYHSHKELLLTDARQLYFSNEDREGFISRLREKGELINVEMQMKHKDGRPVYVIENCSVYKDPDTGEEFIEGAMIDITDRKQIEEALFKSESKYRTVVENIHESLVIEDINGKLVYANSEFSRIFGYAADEIVKLTMKDYTSPESYDDVIERHSKRMKGIPVAQEFVYKGLRKDGTELWIEARVSILMENGKIVGTQSLERDITERRKAEEKIKATNEQLHQLTAHLQNVREEERKRIGREIHDELGQQITAIRMDVAWVDKKTPDEITAVKSKLKNIMALLDGSNESVRKILNELRPGILEDYVLRDALEWQSQQFTENTGIPVAFAASEKDTKLPEQIATCIFRVYQESLTNIMRYAEAGKVVTSLNIDDGSVFLTVEDDGKGFDTSMVTDKKTFGILGMKERVLSLNGEFHLVSTPGKGTKINISLPYK